MVSALEISCAFATSLSTPDHIVTAERLGYRRAWCYDSPALYPDVWITLARAAERTTRIGLGPGVLVPHLRHVMTNAAAAATLSALAPGRVVIGVGAGFTGRLALGQGAHPWREVSDYVKALRALLRGEEVEWEGSVIKMLHPSGFAPVRPIEPPILLATQGPKGLALAREIADGIVTSVPLGGFPWVAHILQGTVLDPGEDPGCDRALNAAGHAAALIYHLMYDVASFPDVETLPGGAEFRRRAEQVPVRTRHLAVHANHLIGLNSIDSGLITGEVMATLGAAADADSWRARLQACADAGVTELLYQPAGDDIDRELRVFAEMAGL